MELMYILCLYLLGCLFQLSCGRKKKTTTELIDTAYVNTVEETEENKEFGEAHNPINDTSFEVPVPKVEAFHDGFAVSIPAKWGMENMEFFGCINKVFTGHHYDIVGGDIYRKSQIVEDHCFKIRYIDKKIRHEYVVYYWILTSRFEVYYRRIKLRFKVRERNGTLVAKHY